MSKLSEKERYLRQQARNEAAEKKMIGDAEVFYVSSFDLEGPDPHPRICLPGWYWENPFLLRGPFNDEHAAREDTEWENGYSA